MIFFFYWSKFAIPIFELRIFNPSSKQQYYKPNLLLLFFLKKTQNHAYCKLEEHFSLPEFIKRIPKEVIAERGWPDAKTAPPMMQKAQA